MAAAQRGLGRALRSLSGRTDWTPCLVIASVGTIKPIPRHVTWVNPLWLTDQRHQFPIPGFSSQSSALPPRRLLSRRSHATVRRTWPADGWVPTNTLPSSRFPNECFRLKSNSGSYYFVYTLSIIDDGYPPRIPDDFTLGGGSDYQPTHHFNPTSGDFTRVRNHEHAVPKGITPLIPWFPINPICQN